MLKTRIMKRIIIMLLVISLIYANLNLAILGLISYAIDDESGETITKVEDENELNIEVSEFSKNNMLEQETEYQEKITLKLNYNEMFNDILISDIATAISKENSGDEQAEVEEKENTNIFYKTTKINKKDLIDEIGIEGKLEIRYNRLEEKSTETQIQEQSNEVTLPEVEDEQKNDTIVLPEVTEEPENGTIVLPKVEEDSDHEAKGTIIAEDGKIEISIETEADEDGYITIVYPENTISVDINIKTETNKIEKLEIIHSKVIETVGHLDEVNKIDVIKQITVTGETELLNTQEVTSMPINYTRTVAELGMDRARNIYKYRKQSKLYYYNAYKQDSI